jgi:hypothetical protein
MTFIMAQAVTPVCSQDVCMEFDGIPSPMLSYLYYGDGMETKFDISGVVSFVNSTITIEMTVGSNLTFAAPDSDVILGSSLVACPNLNAVWGNGRWQSTVPISQNSGNSVVFLSAALILIPTKGSVSEQLKGDVLLFVHYVLSTNVHSRSMRRFRIVVKYAFIKCSL